MSKRHRSSAKAAPIQWTRTPKLKRRRPVQAFAEYTPAQPPPKRRRYVQSQRRRSPPLSVEPEREQQAELFTADDGKLYYALECPHCGGGFQVEITEVNCQIFRHGEHIKTDQQRASKQDAKQVDPHTPKHQCDHLAANETILGCGKPFRMVKRRDGGYNVIKCGYI